MQHVHQCARMYIDPLLAGRGSIALLTRHLRNGTVAFIGAQLDSRGDDMSLRFIGIDPSSGSGESPTVWVDEGNQELVFQGWLPSAALAAECAATEVPGHGKGIPEGEAVIRIPFRMVNLVREACDAAESADVR